MKKQIKKIRFLQDPFLQSVSTGPSATQQRSGHLVRLVSQLSESKKITNKKPLKGNEMKRTTKVTALAALIAATSAGYVAADDNFEYHGYFRSGVLFDATDNMSRATYGGDTTPKGDGNDRGDGRFAGGGDGTGRLGNELGNWWVNSFVKKYELDSGDFIRINTKLEQTGEAERDAADGAPLGDPQWLYGSDTNAGHVVEVAEAFVELGGIAGDGVLWAGRRHYNRDVYAFITDEFHLEIKGTGIGVEDVTVGAGRMDLAFVVQDGNLNGSGNIQNMGDNKKNFHAKYLTDMGIGVEYRYAVDQGEFEYPTAFPTDGSGNTGVEEEDVVTSELALYYNFGDFFMLGSGFSTAMLEFRSTDDGVSDDPETWTEFTAWGGHFAGNILNFPVVSFAIGQDHQIFGGCCGPANYTNFSIVNRLVVITPSIPVGSIGLEVGYEQLDQEVDAVDALTGVYTTWKAVVSPTWAINSQAGPVPEIRLLAGVYGGDNDGEEVDQRTLVGFQADLWW